MNDNFIKKAAVSVGITLSLSFASLSIALERPDEVRVGVFTFTSGPAAAYGEPGRQAAEVMIEEINSEGGIDGVPISATYIDEAQGTEGVMSEFRRLSQDDSYQTMMAALSSGNCLALKPLAEQFEIPTIAWNCDTHQLFLEGVTDYMYRPNGNTVAEFLAYAVYLLSETPDLKTIAIINPDYSFGHDAALILKSALKALKPDVEVVAELYPSLGTPNFQTEISRLMAARPDAIFSNLWGADLENFIRQASPRGLFRQSQAILALGESILQSSTLPDDVIVGVLGDGWWQSPHAQDNAQTVGFVNAYKDRYGSYPVFPSMKMANAFVLMKQAYEIAMERSSSDWPSRNELAEAMSELTYETLTGQPRIREDHDGVVDQIIGMTKNGSEYDFPVLGNMVRFDGETLMPPVGEDPMAWLETLDPSFISTFAAPGSYR